ncbi:MAG: hypothetical protein ACRD0J_01190 [Acidimicrobiales bacterium]
MSWLWRMVALILFRRLRRARKGRVRRRLYRSVGRRARRTAAWKLRHPFRASARAAGAGAARVLRRRRRG